MAMMQDETDEREEELSTLECIWPEIVRGDNDPLSFTLDIVMSLEKAMVLKFEIPIQLDREDGVPASVATLAPATSSFNHLPPLRLHVTLPKDYPADKPPDVTLSTSPAWLPESKLRELEQSMRTEWEEVYRSQVLYSYIDRLQTEANNQFGFKDSLVVSHDLRIELLEFQARAEEAEFNRQTYDCGVCLDPKKGSVCYKLTRCGHIFCKDCLTDFYTNCITEGDVNRVQCMDFSCGIERDDGKKIKPTIAPSELLQIPLDSSLVQRYAELKRKKKMELDKSIVYCPRSWCQAPARSDKYPPLADLSKMTETDDSLPAPVLPQEPNDNDKDIPLDSEDRLRICEKCQYAFCRICNSSWHGPYFICYRRATENQISEEDELSYDFIRKNTSACPVCYASVQKSAGCNHMTCFNCMTHFCYLCSMWLNPMNPYEHFNKEGRPCYQRLWDLYEGDEADGQVQFVGARQWENDAVAFEELVGQIGDVNL